VDSVERFAGEQAAVVLGHSLPPSLPPSLLPSLPVFEEKGAWILSGDNCGEQTGVVLREEGRKRRREGGREGENECLLLVSCDLCVC